MIRLGLAFILLAAAALAAETFTLEFADGKKKTLSVESFDEDGITVTAAAEKERIPWSKLTAASAYAVRAKLTPYEGPQRVALSGFARKLRLYPQAIEQLEIGLALGAMDEGAYEKEASAIMAEEVAYLTGHIDTLVLAKAKPSLLLGAIKRLKERYPEHEANKKYEPLIRDLVEKLAAAAEAVQSKEKKDSEDKALTRLRATLDKIHAKKTKALTKADGLVKASERAIALRQVSRVKRTLVLPSGAEKYYRQARRELRAIVKADPQFLLASKQELEKEWDAIGLKMIDCNLKVARIQIKERNYKGAIKYVRAVLFLDPINEEALSMAEEIRKNRITFKVSDITNARPRVTGG